MYRHRKTEGSGGTLAATPTTAGIESSMTWSGLPLDMVEQILTKLPLAELARTARTNRTFLAVYRRRMAREQKAYCDLAFSSCGRERITCLLAFLISLLNGDPLPADYVERKRNLCWISAEGTLNGPVLESAANRLLPANVPRRCAGGLVFCRTNHRHDRKCPVRDTGAVFGSECCGSDCSEYTYIRNDGRLTLV
jgi:hypothetical protein